MVLTELLQYAYIVKLDKLVTSSSLQMNDRISEIEKLEEGAIKELNENDIVYILCVTNLAKHSLQYWDSEKRQVWLNTLRQKYNSRNNTAAELDWHNVAVADVAAFIVGFPSGVNVGMIVGGVTAGIASAGITAGLGAVLGGIVGGTASGLAAAIGASGVALAAEAVVNWFE